MKRRTFLRLAAGAAALPATQPLAWAQAYPNRPMHLIVGFPPGGSTDLFARLIGQWLSQQLAQPMVIDNKAGAGSNIGAEAVVRAAPDGYTLFELTSVNSFNTALYKNLSFDILRDMVPVASISLGLAVVVVRPTFPARSLPEFIAYAKANPGKLNMASGGVGSPQHVYGELFQSMTGVKMLHVPYRGGAPALADLLAGQASVLFDTISTSIEHIRAGQLRALAVTSTSRSDLLPDVPAVAEYVPGYEAVGWQGIGAPKGTPTEIVDRLNEEVNAGLADPEVKARIADLGYSAFASTPAQFSKFVADYTARWAKVIRDASIKPE